MQRHVTAVESHSDEEAAHMSCSLPSCPSSRPHRLGEELLGNRALNATRRRGSNWR
jgi:hypothetical protein